MFCEEEIIFYNNIIDNITIKLKEKNKIYIDINDININDKIYIEFLPNSQKYIYQLYPKYGIIVNINNNNQLIKIFNFNTNKIENLFHDYVSYYGDIPGYDYTLYKII